MKYSYTSGIEGRKKTPKIWIAIPVVGLLVGSYILLNTFAPAISTPFDAPLDATAVKLRQVQPKLDENRLYVPKINVDVASVEIQGTEAESLEKGAIHRSPNSGNPKDGGNYVLAAHRFQIGLTPNLTRAKSPFYHIDMVNPGDQIYVDYEGVRYAYKVIERKIVPPTDTAIESKTDKNQLTLYSCELINPKSGREVVIAEPIGTIAWVDGTPKLQSL